MPEIDEQEVLKLLKADNPETVKQLFYQFYPFLCNTVFRILKDKAIAEDLAQDTFFKFWDKRASIDIQTSLKAYLRRMAVNEALYYIRKNKKFQKAADVEPGDLGGSTDSVEDQLLPSRTGR